MDFFRLRNEGERDVEDAKKIRPADEGLRRLRAAVYLAEEVGESLGRREILL